VDPWLVLTPEEAAQFRRRTWSGESPVGDHSHFDLMPPPIRVASFEERLLERFLGSKLCGIHFFGSSVKKRAATSFPGITRLSLSSL
jgi:hypothetical protein